MPNFEILCSPALSYFHQESKSLSPDLVIPRPRHRPQLGQATPPSRMGCNYVGEGPSARPVTKDAPTVVTPVRSPRADVRVSGRFDSQLGGTGHVLPAEEGRCVQRWYGGHAWTGSSLPWAFASRHSSSHDKLGLRLTCYLCILVQTLIRSVPKGNKGSA